MNYEEEISQQVRYLSILMNLWFQCGPEVWDCSGQQPNTITLEINGKRINEDWFKVAQEHKRNGRYAESLGLYMRIIEECRKTSKHIPIPTVRGLVKTMIAANEYRMAFSLAMTAYADMQQRIKKGEPCNRIEYGCVEDMYRFMLGAAINVPYGDPQRIIANRSFNLLPLLAKTIAYSGNQNYTPRKSLEAIIAELQSIKKTMEGHLN